MNAMDENRVVIFDTTLRDGEQAPGCSMTLNEKLRVASALRDLRVDVIEAGFPAASPGDFKAVQTIARTIEGPTICGLARCNPRDIKRVWDAVKDAASPRIHVFVATSRIHREHKLQMAKAEILKSAVESVSYARSFCDNVEFSPEDASRTELEYLAEVVEAVAAKLMTYALGRGVDAADMPAIRRIVREAEASDYRWSSLVLGIVRSIPFQLRRAAS